MNSGDLIRLAARIVGAPIRDVETGELLGKAILFTWRGRVLIIGYTGVKPLRPVAVPARKLDYWKVELGFTSPKAPDFAGCSDSALESTKRRKLLTQGSTFES